MWHVPACHQPSGHAEEPTQHSSFGAEKCLTGTFIYGCRDFVISAVQLQWFILTFQLWWSCLSSQFSDSAEILQWKSKFPGLRQELFNEQGHRTQAQEMGGYSCSPRKREKHQMLPQPFLNQGKQDATAMLSGLWLGYFSTSQHTLAVSQERQVWWGMILLWALKMVARLLCGQQGGQWLTGLAEKELYYPRKSAKTLKRLVISNVLEIINFIRNFLLPF